MIERLEPIVRCLRVLYVSAGKGSMLLNDVTQDIASNPRMTMSQLSVQEHVKLLVKVKFLYCRFRFSSLCFFSFVLFFVVLCKLLKF